MTTLPHLVSAGDLAETLGQSKKWVYRQHEERGLPAFKLGRSLLFDASDVLAWLEQQRVSGKPDVSVPDDAAPPVLIGQGGSNGSGPA
jgi:excisionase family DNA binding protein